ncbi:hypothetical protein PV735_46675 [Streptomyces turgidiscabies]|uniref:hypothetical protein n=1 Tax=Streptomyces turgidiscabies TaxID=85558 RepID=UPI00073F425F|nr:hypothetical protein [Streptomyces turgidiscabies]MDX3500106.1 hypothetical protein [Streptomyces turgidiscabies]
MPDPITGEGFDAPTPEVAYMGAPDMLHEVADLTAISERLQVETATAGTKGETYEPDKHQERLYLLRRAALSDRLSLAHPDVEDFLTDAVQLAHQLAEFDRKHDTHVGPIGPSAIEWDPSHRPYVRQEYDHWGW